MNKWGEQTFREDPNSLDIKIAHLMSYAGQAEDQLFMNSGPEIINSETHDSVIRIKHSLWHDIMPAIWKKYPGWETLVDDSCFEKQQWEDRNRIMVNNIVKAAKEYAGKRLVVVTGATHRYILRDLLKNEPAVELKEYWEITSLGINKPCEPNEPNQPAYLKVIPPEKLKEDLDFLFKTIEEVHPNMYAYTSKEEFAPIRKQVYEDINQPMKQVEFFKLVSPVVAQLKNGHMNLDFPYGFEVYISSGGKVFPLKFYWDGDKAILSENRGKDSLPMGGIVEAINGENVGRLIRKLAKYRADERKSSDEFFAGIYLHRYLWLEYGSTELWKLRIKDMNGKTSDYVVNGISWEKYLANNPHKPDFSYEYLGDYNAGLIKFKSCLNLEKFNIFLKETFQKMKEQKVSNLIIDIRHNAGGESTLASALLDYITDKPFRMAERCTTKISQQMYGDNLENIKKEFRDEKIKIGSIVSTEESLVQPNDNPLRFKGKCYLLIDRLVFSSGSEFASVVKCFNIATVIGGETWGTTATYGAIREHILPNSGLKFDVPSKYIVQACGKPDGRGIIPDYEVKQRPEDTAKGVDTVLQFTLNLIKDPNFGIRPKIKQIDKTGID
jgi:hypothetical protein